MAAIGVLRDRRFRALYAARALSLLGDGIVPVALAFAVLRVDPSPTALGVVLAAQAVPRVGLILAGGVLGDRLSRRNLMLTTDLVRFVSQGTVAALLLTQHARLWHLVGLSAVYGCAAAFFLPASTGLIPQVVREDELQEANALLSLTSSAFELVGPIVAGLLVATVGAGWAFAADSATFLLSAVFLLRIRDLGAMAVPDPATFLAQLREGWREVRSRTWLLMDGIFSALGNAVTLAPIFVLGPVVARRSLGGAGAWAAISAAFGVGAIAGGAVALRVRPQRPLVVGWALLALFGLPAAALAVPAHTVVIAIGAFLAGLALNVANTLFETALQRNVPAHALSRATSFTWLLALLLQPIGFAAVGPISTVIGIRTTLLAAAVWAFVSTCIVLAAPGVRNLRSSTASRESPTASRPNSRKRT